MTGETYLSVVEGKRLVCDEMRWVFNQLYTHRKMRYYIYLNN